ncbi:pitrilysin family protein [Sphingobium sp.]|uniref:M16 family metallopeptidase n=1 Tax=Sphingobium sp. TaxID=1912891 RepID=UPI00262FB6D7|nr:pitrilysin family protein [Sphingobium sp.]
MIRRVGMYVVASALALATCLASPGVLADAPAARTLIPTERFVLPNGLRVVMNIDRSDPVAAVALVAHVGSAREVKGRTGFAHMFEHLFFLNSENLGPGGLDKLTARVGGSGANGYTNLDHTVYLQTVPKDALEKMLWAEADKLGFFINTVTPAVVAKEIEVVKNEKRQSYDNQPYGQLTPILQEALYPADHPYSWTTIGSLADLSAATIDDVRQFYQRWYVPNNATLVISGDIDPAQTRLWVEKYFGEIARGPDVDIPRPRPARLSATRKLMHLDSFASLPQLTLVWPTAPEGDPDDAASELLFDALGNGPDGPVYRAVVEDAKLSDAVEADIWDEQMAGVATLQVRGFDGVTLDSVANAIDKGLAQFGATGITAERLERLKAVREAQLYAELGSVLGKVQVIAESETVRRKPDQADVMLAQLRNVTVDDIMRVYRKYVASHPRLEIGFVPKDQPQLALTGAATAHVVEEPIVQGAEQPVDQNAGRVAVARTPSRIDRSIEPPAGAPPLVKAPPVWTSSLANGLALSGIEDRELPVAKFEIAIDGGQLRDDAARPGAAHLAAAMLTRGTRTKTREQFANALKALGADIDVTVDQERTLISGTTLSRNFAQTLALVEEMLTAPRWDAGELALAKAASTAELQGLMAEPDYLADMVARRALYGDTVLANDPRGTVQSIAALTMDDLKAFMAKAYSPKAARVRVAGAIGAGEAQSAFAGLAQRWTGADLSKAGGVAFAAPTKTKVYFYDVSGAKQSAILFVHPGPARSAPDWFDARAANFILGGGGFASRLTQEVREGKGYTYGVRSAFSVQGSGGRFTVASPVRANVTLEAATLMRDIVRDYGATYSDADLALTKTSLAKARAREFETLDAKLRLLGSIGDYGLPTDIVDREGQALAGLDKLTVQTIARSYMDTDHMVIVVVGDAATQAKRLEALGYGAPVMVPPIK